MFCFKKSCTFTETNKRLSYEVRKTFMLDAQPGLKKGRYSVIMTVKMIDETLHENAYSNEEHEVNKLIRLFGRKRDKTVHFY